MLKVLIVLLLIATISVNIFFIPPQVITGSQKVERYFKKNLASTISKLNDIKSAIDNNSENKETQEAFRQARDAYKRIEFLIEYYYPDLARKINGPPLPFTDGENSIAVLAPQGSRLLKKYFSHLMIKNRKLL